MSLLYEVVTLGARILSFSVLSRFAICHFLLSCVAYILSMNMVCLHLTVCPTSVSCNSFGTYILFSIFFIILLTLIGY